MKPELRAPLRLVEVLPSSTIEDYAAVAHLAAAVSEMRLEAERVVGQLAGRTIWMVNSTVKGGGVAEMLPTAVTLLRGLGLRVEWVVIGSPDPAFFQLTKRIHNLIHGIGVPDLGGDERNLYEAVNRANADALREVVRRGDIVVIHDPQPLPMARFLQDTGLVTVWRSHIGLDAENAATRAAWSFLSPYLDAYDAAVFSAPEYIPEQLTRRATVIFPGIDPLAPKNRELSLRQAIEVMCNGGLVPCPGPTVSERYLSLAQRVLPDGTWAPVSATDNLGLLTRPIVTQISRWDRLKGFLPLMQAFVELKRSIHEGPHAADPLHRKQLDIARLVLAGPDPDAIQDDPEARDVLDELRSAYTALTPPIRDEIAILLLPLHSLEENALMVNALQRASTIVAQNSLREGFGLTIAEAMWKRVPVLSNALACGPRQQVRDGLDGRLVADPADPVELARALSDMLADPVRLERWGHSAQRRVHEHFLIFGQLRAWAQLFPAVLARHAEGSAG
jgi:trehalose synthase